MEQKQKLASASSAEEKKHEDVFVGEYVDDDSTEEKISFCDATLVTDDIEPKTNGCFVHTKGGEIFDFEYLLRFLWRRLGKRVVPVTFDWESFVAEGLRAYATKQDLPPFASDGPMERLFVEMLRADIATVGGDFRIGLTRFLNRVRDLYPKNITRLRNLMASKNGGTIKHTEAGVKTLLKFDALCPVTALLSLLSGNLTPKEYVALKTIYPKIGENWRIYDCDKKRLFNAEEYADEMGSVKAVEIIRKFSEDAITAEARNIVVDSVLAKLKALKMLKKSGDKRAFFSVILKRCIEERDTIEATVFKAAIIESGADHRALTDALINELKECLRSEDPDLIDYALDTAKGVQTPSVYVPVCNEAYKLAKDLHLRRDIKAALKADVASDAAKKAYRKLVTDERLQSTPEEERGQCHHRHFKKPCTRKVDLDLADACAVGGTTPSELFDHIIYASEVLIDATILSPLFEAEISRIQGKYETLIGVKVSMGPIKDIERVRIKAMEDKGSKFPKSGAVIDMLRCTLRFTDMFKLVETLYYLRRKWKWYGRGKPRIREGRVTIQIVRVKNGYGDLEKPFDDFSQYSDVKINILIRSLVEGRVVTVIGEVQMSVDGMSAYKVLSHAYYAITRQSDLYKAAALQMADFSLAKLYDGVQINRLVKAGYDERVDDKLEEGTTAKKCAEMRLRKAFLRVVSCASVSYRSLATVIDWFNGNPFETLPTEVVDFAFDQIITRRCNRQDFAKTLTLIPPDTLQSLLERCERYPYYAAVVRYCERVTLFKEDVAAMLVPTEIPPKWPMGADPDIDCTALELTAAACARFGADATRVRFVKDMSPTPEPRADTLRTARDMYMECGGHNCAVIAALM